MFTKILQHKAGLQVNVVKFIHIDCPGAIDRLCSHPLCGLRKCKARISKCQWVQSSCVEEFREVSLHSTEFEAILTLLLRYNE